MPTVGGTLVLARNTLVLTGVFWSCSLILVNKLPRALIYSSQQEEGDEHQQTKFGVLQGDASLCRKERQQQEDKQDSAVRSN